MFIIRISLRHTEAQKKTYVDDENRRYRYKLRVLSEVHPNLESARTFVCTIQLQPRGNRDMKDPDVLLLSDIGKDSLMKEDNEENEFAGTISAMNPGNIAT